MHATIRRYEGVDMARTNEVTGKVNEKLVPELRKLPGFAGYYLIEAGNGVLSSLGLFETPEQADESTKVVAKWITDENLETAIPTRRRSQAARSLPRATASRPSRSSTYSAPAERARLRWALSCTSPTHGLLSEGVLSDARTRSRGYALHVKRLRAFLERLPGGHRPPTGPMTTAEATEAEKVRQETPATDDQRTVDEQDEAGAPGTPRCLSARPAPGRATGHVRERGYEGRLLCGGCVA